MKKYKFEYEYCDLERGERQYDNIDLSDTMYVDASYIQSEIIEDRGNPFIEALPLPRTAEEVFFAYTKDIMGYDYEKELKYDVYRQRRSIALLRQLRMPLPFHEELEYICYNVIATSYRARRLAGNIDIDIPIIFQGEIQNIHSILLGDSSDATNSGFKLLGYSGCGKSSALKILFSNYPQVIMHHNGITRIPQITYLVVNCITNSNFTALYDGIGKAIDMALGNFSGCYKNEIKKIRNLGLKVDKVCELIEKFSIGIIVFDEIQLIDFDSSKENSFEGLLTICNETKVGMGIVGTEEAYDKMFTILRTSRRTGKLIEGNLYCQDKRFFSVVANSLFRYTWFNEQVKLNADILNALYDNTKGIIDQLISIYMFMQLDYIAKKKKPEINRAFIDEVAEKHYPGIKDILDKNDAEAEKKRNSIKKKAEEELSSILDNQNQREFAALIEEKMGSIDVLDRRHLLKNVIHNIQMIEKSYNMNTIQEVFEKVINVKANADKDEAEITSKVWKKLKDGPKDTRPQRKNKVSHQDMKMFLENE